MAKRKKKILEDSKAKQLKIIADQYFPGQLKDKFLEAIASTGTIPQELFDQGNFNPNDRASVLDMVTQVTGGKPTERDYTQAELKAEVGGPDQAVKSVDEASLTDEELGSRRSAFDELGQTQGNLQWESVQKSIADKMKSYGVTDNTDALAYQITELTQQLGRYPSSDEIATKITGKPNTGGSLADTPFKNFINDQNATNELSSLVSQQIKAPETTDDLKRIDDILAQRKTEADRNTQIDEFVSSIPGELAGPTNERIKALREIGGRSFEEQAPAIVARENAMGRFNSGAVGDVLGSTYADINQDIESRAANLLQGDETFYFNAAYQNQVRKMLEGKADLSSSIGVERQNVRTEQENRFQEGQFDLNANLENDLLMQKYENQIKAAQEARRRQQEIAAKQSKFGTAAGVGGITGTVIGGTVGGLLGGPLGVGVGASVGGGAGTAVGGLFGSQ